MTVWSPNAIVLGGEERAGVSLHVEGSRVVRLSEEPGEPLEGTLLPGTIDLQVNGAAGFGIDQASTGELDQVAEAVWNGGSVAFLPTLITASFDALLEQLARVAGWIDGYRGDGARPLGIHLEGPFLEAAGAHPPEHLLEPTPERIDALLEAAAGKLRLVTLAPGVKGAAEATARLTDAGVLVSLGHGKSTAGFDACVNAGARKVTHLFNAMSGVHHRDASVALSALDEERLTLGLIADGHHVTPAALRLAWNVAGPDRIVLVSDAAAPAGAPDGEYLLGDSPVRSEGGVVRDGEGRLAGSAALMADVVRGLRAAVPEVTAANLARMCSDGPADLLGLESGIREGMEARFSVLRPSGLLEAIRLDSAL